MSDSHGEHIPGMSARTELELYWRIFFASSDYIAFSRLSDGTCIDVNPGFERMMGFSRAEVVGRTSFEIGIWPDDEKEQRSSGIREAACAIASCRTQPLEAT